MSILLLKILFVLSMWIYFIFEGLTEGIGTSNNPNLETKKQQDKYHLLRLGENLGVIIAVHLLFIFFKAYYMIGLFWLTVPSGLGLYEIAFSWIKYKNLLYNKASKWLFIPHPPGWVSIIVVVLFILIKCLVII